MSNLSSKLKKANKKSHEKKLYERETFQSKNASLDKTLDLNSLPFELKPSRNLFFFSPKLLLFVALSLSFLFFSDTFDIFQKYANIFPTRYSTQKYKNNFFSYESKFFNRAIYFIFFAVISFGVLFLPNSYFNRPHRIMWRFILACAMCYLALIIFILFHVIT